MDKRDLRLLKTALGHLNRVVLPKGEDDETKMQRWHICQAFTNIELVVEVNTEEEER